MKTAQEEDGYDEAVEELKEWVRNRKKWIMDTLAQGLPQGDDAPETCQESALLYMAGLDLASIYILTW